MQSLSPPPWFRMKVFSDESLQLKFLSRLCSLHNIEQVGAKAKFFLFSHPIFNNTTYKWFSKAKIIIWAPVYLLSPG